MTLAGDIGEQINRVYQALRTESWDVKERKKFFSERTPSPHKKDRYIRFVIGELVPVRDKTAGYISFTQSGWDLNAFMDSLGSPKAPSKFSKNEIAKLEKQNEQKVAKGMKSFFEYTGSSLPHYDIEIAGKEVRIVHEEEKKEISFVCDEPRPDMPSLAIEWPREIMSVTYDERAVFRLFFSKRDEPLHPHLQPTLEYVLDDRFMRKNPIPYLN